ncbi:MAG TPA: hypothetical protein VG056_11105, partial [Pirellulales bacterium]|nr:hypothetical protein [Pirellulales bacterium]
MATETKPNKPAKRQALEFLRSSAVSAKPTGVDEERKKISGVILAKTGPFKSGRGEFDLKSLNMLAKIIGSKSKGSKSRMGHPNPSHPGARQEVDSFLGRFSDPRVEPNPDEPDGHVLRGDLALDPVSFLSKSGGVSDGDYLMARAKSDPDSFGTSLVLSA